jgi:nucleoside-diphosphate-sugar epimerase
VNYLIDTKIFQEDVDQITSDTNIPGPELSGASVFITGATGLIGSALVHALAAANKKHTLNLILTGNGRNTVKGKRLTQECGMDSFIEGDVRTPLPTQAIPERLDYIFHCAAITRSADMVARPVDVITTAVEGTRNILELAKNRHCKSLVYLSLMEVYGRTELNEVRETDLGHLDLSNPRSTYPESKRLCESLCVACFARLAQTFGAGTPQDDTRVFAQFARNAVAGENIALHTEGKSRGNYCYTADTVRGLLMLLSNGSNGEAYNVANPETSLTIREMANLPANEVFGGKIEVVVKIPRNVENLGYATDVGFRLNVDKLKTLGWKPRYGCN